MTKEQFAERLNGRQIGEEMVNDDIKLAKESGLVVVYAYSDDTVEFHGKIRDEIYRNDGGDVYLDWRGVLSDHEDCECDYCGYKDRVQEAKKIKAIWNDGEFSWRYETNIPHVTFDIFEEADPFCKGIVFDFSELQK